MSPTKIRVQMGWYNLFPFYFIFNFGFFFEKWNVKTKYLPLIYLFILILAKVRTKKYTDLYIGFSFGAVFCQFSTVWTVSIKLILFFSKIVKHSTWQYVQRKRHYGSLEGRNWEFCIQIWNGKFIHFILTGV